MPPMEDVDLRYAKEHLEELLSRAARGEDVAIVDPAIGRVRLTGVEHASRPATRPERRPGRWKDRLNIPDDAFLEP